MNSVLVNEQTFIASYKNKKLGHISLQRKSHLLPLCASEELAGIIGDLMSDGHIGSNMVIFSSNNLDSLQDFGKRAKKLFKINFEIRKVITNTYGVKSLYIFDAPLLRILRLSGVPEGNKVLKKYQIPKWILQNDIFMTEFLKRLYGNDGCVTVGRNRIKIKILFHKSEHILNDNYQFLESIRSFLATKNIKSTNVYKSGYYNRRDGIKTIGLGFEIQGTKSNMNSVLNFYRFVGFYNKAKRKKLEAFIKNCPPKAPVAMQG